MPITHNEFYKQYKKDFDDLGSNHHGTKNGLVVPKYMDINSIEELK
ncbi:glycine betaine ABC transporter substrate-binding protein [Neobacillus sp. NPDC097160]